ncbi:MAG: TetR/AcrR family transcriptional regulator [Georgfuchsia sp.]
MTCLDTRNGTSLNNLHAEFRRAVAAGDCTIIAPRNPILLPQLSGVASPPGQRWSAMRNRKANILAMTRRLIAEQSFDHVVLQRLAERSNVTIPTIYNLIGSRSEVLQLATNEALQAKIVFATAKAELEQLNPILVFVDTLWLGLANDPAYSRQLLRGIAYRDSDGWIGGFLFREMRSAMEKWLNKLATTGNFRDTGMSTRAMAKFICWHIDAAVTSWRENESKLSDLRRNLTQGVGLFLLGALMNEEARSVTKWLKRLEQ